MNRIHKLFVQRLIKEIITINKLSFQVAFWLLFFGVVIYTILLSVDYSIYRNSVKANNFFNIVADPKSLYAYISISLMTFCGGLLMKILNIKCLTIHITSVKNIAPTILGVFYADIVLVFLISFFVSTNITHKDIMVLFFLINSVLCIFLVLLRHDYTIEKKDKYPAIFFAAIAGIFSIIFAWNL